MCVIIITIIIIEEQYMPAKSCKGFTLVIPGSIIERKCAGLICSQMLGEEIMAEVK